MADRRDYFFLQKVQEDELDAGFDGLEDAVFNFALDLGFFGIMFGLAVLEQTPTPDLTVRVSGPGAAYDVAGQRAAIPATQTLDLSVDSSAVSTAVAAPGNEKIVSAFIKFKRVESDPRIDGNSATVFFVQDEGFEFVVSQGAEGLPPAAPPILQPDAILLADVTRTFGQTQIFNADIAAGDTALGGAITDRRQDHIVIDEPFIDIRTGSFAVALQQLAAEINAFVAGAAAAITYAGGPAWADGVTNPSTSVEAQLDKIISDLAGAAGSAKIFAAAIADSPDSLAGARLDNQLVELLGHVNDRLELAGGTLTGNLLPNASGLDLGSAGARWDVFALTLNATGQIDATSSSNNFPNNLTCNVLTLGSTPVSEGVIRSTNNPSQFFSATPLISMGYRAGNVLGVNPNGTQFADFEYIGTAGVGRYDWHMYPMHTSSLLIPVTEFWNTCNALLDTNGDWDRQRAGERAFAHVQGLTADLTALDEGFASYKIRELPLASGDANIDGGDWRDRVELDARGLLRFTEHQSLAEYNAEFTTAAAGNDRLYGTDELGDKFALLHAQSMPKAFSYLQSNGAGGFSSAGFGVATQVAAGSVGTLTFHEPFVATTYTVVTGTRQASAANVFVSIFNQGISGFDFELEDAAGGNPNLSATTGRTFFFLALGDT